jgi:hypothetical protein
MQFYRLTIRHRTILVRSWFFAAEAAVESGERIRPLLGAFSMMARRVSIRGRILPGPSDGVGKCADFFVVRETIEIWEIYSVNSSGRFSAFNDLSE